MMQDDFYADFVKFQVLMSVTDNVSFADGLHVVDFLSLFCNYTASFCGFLACSHPLASVQSYLP